MLIVIKLTYSCTYYFIPGSLSNSSQPSVNRFMSTGILCSISSLTFKRILNSFRNFIIL